VIAGQRTENPLLAERMLRHPSSRPPQA
jgi:hypothetical protein